MSDTNLNPFGGMSIDFGGLGDGGGHEADGIGGATVPVGDRPAITPRPATAADATPRATRLLILGSGPAGLTAAIYAARANLAPIVLAGHEPGGQLTITSDVENFPGFPDGIQGPELMIRFRQQAERFGTTVVDSAVDRVDFGERPFRAWASGVEYRADAVIVATGASAIWLGLESEERLRGRGVSACATCDGFFFRDQEVAIVGGGDTAMEEALYLTRFATTVHLVHRRDEFRASRIMVHRAENHPKIVIHRNRVIHEILGEEHVTGLLMTDAKTGEEQQLPVSGVFIAIGHRPNTGPFEGWLTKDAKGYLIVRDETRSGIQGVFVAGDVHDHRYRQAITAAGDGCRAAIDAERWLEEQAEAAAATTAVVATS